MSELHPKNFKPHKRGDGRKFHTRKITACAECGPVFQVYGLGLQHICTCERSDMAQMVADALEVVGQTLGKPS